MIKVKFFTQEDYHRHESHLDFNVAQSGYFLHWGLENNVTTAIVRALDGRVYIVYPEWVKFEEDPIGVLLSRLVDLTQKYLSEEKLDEMKAIVTKYLS
jgi:hypothetical protein